MDALGLALEPRDGLHLTAAGQLLLGRALARAWAALTIDGTPRVQGSGEGSGEGGGEGSRGGDAGAAGATGAMGATAGAAAAAAGGFDWGSTKTGTATTPWGGAEWAWAEGGTEGGAGASAANSSKSSSGSSSGSSDKARVVERLRRAFDAVAGADFSELQALAASLDSAPPPTPPPPADAAPPPPPPPPAMAVGGSGGGGAGPLALGTIGSLDTTASLGTMGGGAGRPRNVNFVYGEVCPASVAVLLAALG